MDEKELKEIEEMTKDAYEKCPTGCCYRGDLRGKCIIRQLYLAGYRKPREDEVVLTKEEYERLRLKATNNEYDEIRDKLYLFEYATSEARKEAAKEILGKLLSVVQDKRNKLTITTRDPSIGGQCKAYADMETTLREIALDINVEVEE